MEILLYHVGKLVIISPLVCVTSGPAHNLVEINCKPTKSPVLVPLGAII